MELFSGHHPNSYDNIMMVWLSTQEPNILKAYSIPGI